MRCALALMAALGALPAFAQAPAAQVVCAATTEGSRGEAVTVFIHIEPDGRRPAVYASWLPPVLESSGVGGLDQPDLSLLIGYNAVSQSGLGPRNQTAQVLVQTFSPLRATIPSARLQTRLASFSGEARYDGGAPVKFGFNQPGPAHQDLPGTAMRSAELGLPAALPGEIELRLVGKQGKIALTVRYATGTTTIRDTLFASAWAEAEAKAADPAKCDPTGGDMGFAGVDAG